MNETTQLTISHKVLIRIEQDSNNECPLENDGAWRIVVLNDSYKWVCNDYKRSRSRFDTGYRDSYVNEDSGKMLLGARSRFDAATLVPVNFSGNRGEISGMSTYPSLEIADADAVLLLDSPGDIGKAPVPSRANNRIYRLDSAKQVCKTFTAWAQNEIAGYTVSFEADGCEMTEFGDSCGGFYVHDKENTAYLIEAIQDAIDEYCTGLPGDIQHTFEIVVTGDYVPYGVTSSSFK